MYQIVIDSDVFIDIQDAVDWYNLQKKGLGETFFLHFDNELQRLAANPLAYAVKYDSIRCKLIAKFPYSIHYSVNEQLKIVAVVGVFHTSRNPDIWKG